MAEFEAGLITLDMLHADEQRVHAFQSQLGGAWAPGPNRGDQSASEIGRASPGANSAAADSEGRVRDSMPPLCSPPCTHVGFEAIAEEGEH